MKRVENRRSSPCISFFEATTIFGFLCDPPEMFWAVASTHVPAGTSRPPRVEMASSCDTAVHAVLALILKRKLPVFPLFVLLALLMLNFKNT